MKFTIERDVLADAVGWAARALPARPAAPVLAGMHLAVNGQLFISTFDYEVSAEAIVPMDADEDGVVLVPGRLLAEIVKSLPPRPVTMEADHDGPTVTLTCGPAKFVLRTMPRDEYPALPGMPLETGRVGADLLAAAIHQVAVAAGRDDTLPALTGLRMEIDGDTITLVATDRYRLAVRELKWEPSKADVKATLLVPARTLADAAKSFGGAAQVSIGITEQGDQGATGIIGWEAGGRKTTTRLLGGEYPRYQALLP